MRVEEAAATQWEVDCFKVARAYRITKHVIGYFRIVTLRDAVLVVIAAKRQLTGKGCAHDAGHLPDRLQGLREEMVVSLLVEAAIRGVHLHCEQAAGVEAWADRKQMVEPAPQQAGADQEHKSKRNLGDDERAARPLMSADNSG